MNIFWISVYRIRYAVWCGPVRPMGNWNMWERATPICRIRTQFNNGMRAFQTRIHARLHHATKHTYAHTGCKSSYSAVGFYCFCAQKWFCINRIKSALIKWYIPAMILGVGLALWFRSLRRLQCSKHYNLFKYDIIAYMRNVIGITGLIIIFDSQLLSIDTTNILFTFHLQNASFSIAHCSIYLRCLMGGVALVHSTAPTPNNAITATHHIVP